MLAHTTQTDPAEVQNTAAWLIHAADDKQNTSRQRSRPGPQPQWLRDQLGNWIDNSLMDGSDDEEEDN